MSLQLINQYYSNLDRILRFGGSRNETAIRSAFYKLLNEYAHKRDLELVTEISCIGTKGKAVNPDGILKNALRLDYGYWESKDESDDINDEIVKKIRKGYPLTNILFEDSSEAILYQNGSEVMRVNMKNDTDLDTIITAFISFEQPEVKEFNKALEQFKTDVPDIVRTLREKIEGASTGNQKFIKTRDQFFKLCQQEINPDITTADIREMIIQHILTADIFDVVFDESHFHRENNIAKELEKVIDTFFTGSARRNALESIQHYYKAINVAAAGIADHHEKQKFLKVVYENFYKVYNPKAADRLGVIYTPNEIVHFMVESTDYLLYKHFARGLADKNVEILDPATGTGTFICDIIEYIPPHKVDYKYQTEIHANEVGILPYYVANLNIEFTFKQRMGFYREFENICFVDTLDNTGGLIHSGKQEHMFGVSTENTARIKRQNKKKISVIIGNPPYNANQKNETENNKNREYPLIDKRIKDTYIRESKAQKTKLYDMYTRFLRWATDRIDKNGIVAFVTNNSFLDSSSYDGFRKVVAQEFNEIYIIDLKGNARTSGERRRREGGNVFNNAIRVGVAVYFLVKNEKESGCRIYYNVIGDYVKSVEKREYLRASKIQNVMFDELHPDSNHNWLNIANTNFEELIPVANKETKMGKRSTALFKLYTLGVVSNRDEWVYDRSAANLTDKVEFFIEEYNKEVSRLRGKATLENVSDLVSAPIKFTRDVKKDLVRRIKYTYRKEAVRDCLYRPFTKKKLYFAAELNEMQYQMPVVFPLKGSKNLLIAINQGSKSFNVMASKYLVDLHFNGDSQCFPLYTYDVNGSRHYNITDWSLKQFRETYDDKTISREDIFHYTYAVLHNPAYREEYLLDLKRDFPRLPFYPDFQKWLTWGKKLMDLHVNYERAKLYPLLRQDRDINPPAKQKVMFEERGHGKKGLFEEESKIRLRLKADKESGTIVIDEQTTLLEVPHDVWEYKLGHYSAIEWVLDQYKERKPGDPTIAEKFYKYKFSDYKDDAIELLKRVCTVSIETMKIVREMEVNQKS